MKHTWTEGSGNFEICKRCKLLKYTSIEVISDKKFHKVEYVNMKTGEIFKSAGECKTNQMRLL